MFAEVCEVLSVWAIPFLLLVIPVVGYIRRVRVYEAFVEGAAEGFQTSIRLMPYLVAMMVAVSIFRVSGALDDGVAFLQPVLTMLGVPAALVPLAVMRPLSGTGALGLTTEILHTAGPDSLIGRMASTVLAGTDTTFYILTVYFGAVGVRNPRYSLAVGLLGDITGFFAAVYVCRLLFT